MKTEMEVNAKTVVNVKTVLVVEDDKRLNQMMVKMLQQEGYLVSSVEDGHSAIAHITNDSPDIVLLDMMLPGCDGLTVLQKTAAKSDAIIIMITAKKDDYLEVSALNIGVHDFISKPVRPHILLARLRALSRLTEKNSPNRAGSDDDVLTVQALSLNLNAREFFLDGTLIEMSDAELEVILYFMRNPGVIISREMMIKTFRNIEYDGFDRSIDMRISSIRKKLNDTSPPYKYIKTIRARGYLLVE